MTRPVNQTALHRVDDGSAGPAAPSLQTLRHRLGHWLRVDAARLLWPNHCLVCEAPGLDGLDLCAACVAELPWNHCACPRCALPLPVTAAHRPNSDLRPNSEQVCGDCLRREADWGRRGRAPALDGVHAGFVYAAPLDCLLPRFKFHRDLASGALLAQLMAEACARLPRPDALVPVSLHRTRLRQRGYDQALELARPLARSLDLSLRDDLLQRARPTAPQSELSAVARRRNLRDAFAVNPDAPLSAHVALIDDVMTTGATLWAAANALKRAGVQRVDAWVCARVP